MPIVSVTLAVRRATSSSVHWTDTRSRVPQALHRAYLFVSIWLCRRASWALCVGLMVISIWYLPTILDQVAIPLLGRIALHRECVDPVRLVAQHRAIAEA